MKLTRREALSAIGAGTLTMLGARLTAQGADWHWLSVEDVGRLIASRKVSSVEVTRRMLDRIAVVDKTLNSYATVMGESALAAAREADAEIKAGKHRGPLHGVPVAVKDLCYTRGVRTMGGAFVTRDFVPDADATVVTKLRSAGAIVIGKLNLTEGAMLGYHPEMGIPRNPWNTELWPGGSSSGSGVATAAGLCFASIGTDTGGSIRYPSSANGIVGLKPTYGAVSRHGVLGLSGSLDHVGPMARRVVDVAIMHDAIAGRDPRDTTSLVRPSARAAAQIAQPITGMRIGIDREYALKGINVGQAASIEEALKVLEGLGARIVDVKMPDLGEMVNTWLWICGPEALAFHKATYPARANDYGVYFRGFLELSARVTSEQAAKAQAWRTDFNAKFTTLLESVDAMVCPAGGAPAWPVSRALQLGGFLDFSFAMAKWLPRAGDFTMPMNLAGTPSICLPSGFSPDGLPYSIQFAGRRLSEPALCRIAHAYEQATKWHLRHPAV
jgi:amidase